MTQVTAHSSPTNRLSITEAQFNKCYPDLVGYYNFFNDDPPSGLSKEQFEKRYLSNKLWRLNNVYTVINKRGNPVTFRMNLAQHKVYGASRQHPRVVILKSRQQGISTFWLVSYFDDAICCPHLSLGLMAQGLAEAATLLERVKFLWDQVDTQVKDFLKVRLVKDNAKAVSFSNKSVMYIRVSFRSATLQRLHISELGKIANNNPLRAKETKTGTLQALGKGNTGVIESTAEGHNMFKEIWDSSISAFHSEQMTTKDFLPVFLSWLDDPDCTLDVYQTPDKAAIKYFKSLPTIPTTEQQNFWIAQHRELGSEISQEYPATPEEAFMKTKDGTYYARLYSEFVIRANKFKADVYDPNLPVDVYFDLGVDDYCVVGFTQWYRDEYRLVGEYFNNGYALQHYLQHILDSKFDVRNLVFPHDVKVREQGASDGDGRALSREEIVRQWIRKHKLGWGVSVLARSSIADGIEATRTMCKNLVVDTSCTYIHSCMLNYSKEYDEKLQCWKLTPKHDEYSHGADLMRQVAVGLHNSESSHKNKREQKQRRKSSGFAV